MNSRQWNIFHLAARIHNEKTIGLLLDFAREKDWGSPKLLKMDNDGMNIFHHASFNRNEEILH